MYGKNQAVEAKLFEIALAQQGYLTLRIGYGPERGVSTTKQFLSADYAGV